MTVDPIRRTRKLRELLARPGLILSMGAHDVLSALLIEEAGFETVFLGGFGASASLYGLPDLGFLGLEDMAHAVERTARRVSIPLIADGDTGHGDIHNIVRSVERFEAAGAAGVIFEDQVYPKRCGHFEGKRVIPLDAMVRRWKVALRARSDPDFVCIARTDAREPNGLEDAIERANRYCDAGADMAFIEAPESRDELETIARRVPHPLLVNMLSFGKTPILARQELELMGYKIVVAPIESLLVTVRAVRDVARAFLRDGHLLASRDALASLGEVKQLLGVDRFLSLGREG